MADIVSLDARLPPICFSVHFVVNLSGEVEFEISGIELGKDNAETVEAILNNTAMAIHIIHGSANDNDIEGA